MATVTRFPEHESYICQLMMVDETFRAVCVDLADAESALARVDYLPEAVRDERRAEYEELVAYLVREIAEVLAGKPA